MDREELTLLDRYWMQKALAYGRKWEGLPAPNPGVVALLANPHALLGRSQHRIFGEEHAERKLLQSLKVKQREIQKSTLYCTLEPCPHLGKTPPCTEIILRYKVPRVVISCKDPHPLVNGKGIAALRKGGVKVIIGTFRKQCQNFHRKHFFFQRYKIPFVSLKWAMSLDGKIADYKKRGRYITGRKALQKAHLLRLNHNAIAVGIGTVLADDPLLLPRFQFQKYFKTKKSYVRIVIDSHFRLPLASKLVKTARQVPVWVFGSSAKKQRMQNLEERGVVCICVRQKDSLVSLKSVLHYLGQRNISSLLVEGGEQLLTTFLYQSLFQELHLFLAPKVIGGKKSPTPSSGKGMPLSSIQSMPCVEKRQLGKDFYFFFRRE